MGMYIPPERAQARTLVAYMHIFCVRLLRCPFYYTRQCEGLSKRNGQLVRLSRFLFFQTYRKETAEESLWFGLHMIRNFNERALKSIFPLLLACVMTILTGCGDDGQDDEPTSDITDIEGTWYGTRSYINNGAVKYQNIILRLNSDNTGAMEYESQTSYSVAYFVWSVSGGYLICDGAYASTSGDVAADYHMECRIESGRLIPTGQFSAFILTKDNSVMTDGDGNEIDSPERQIELLTNVWVTTDGKKVIRFYSGGTYDEYTLDYAGSGTYSTCVSGSYSFAPLNKTLTLNTTLWTVVTLSESRLVLQKGTATVEYRIGDSSDIPSGANLAEYLTSASRWADSSGKYTFMFRSDGDVTYFEDSFRKYGSWGDVALVANGTFYVSGSEVTCNFSSVTWTYGGTDTADYFPDWTYERPCTKTYRIEVTPSSALQVTMPDSKVVYLYKQ